MLRSILLFILLIVLTHVKITAQVNQDTLNMYYGFLSSGNYTSAVKVMSAYERNHPSHPEALLLLARVYTYTYSDKTAETFYRKATHAAPTNQEIACEYAEFLLNHFKFTQAEKELNRYKDSEKSDRNKFLMAKYHFWKGNYKTAYKLSKEMPNESKYKSYADEISIASMASMAPLISYEYSGYNDNQVLNGKFHHLFVSQQFSELWQPNEEFQWMEHQALNQFVNKYIISFANTFSFPESGVKFKLKAGLFQHQFSTSSERKFIGAISYKHQLNKDWEAEVSYTREPYLFNKYSVLTSILNNKASAKLSFNNSKWGLAEIAYQNEQFDPEIKVNTFYAWGMLSVIGRKKIKWRLGYGYNYSNSNQSAFVSKITITDWLNAGGIDPISGYYSPCFTPLSQQIHSLITQVVFKLRNNLEFSASASYGFYAKANIPYLFPDVDGTTLFFNSSSSPMNFHPAEVMSKLIYKTNSKLNWHGSYHYLLNNFYTGHTFKLGFSYLLYSEKK